MNHGAEIERIAAEYSRRNAAILDDLADANARTAARSRELAARSADRLSALVRDLEAVEARTAAAATAPDTPAHPAAAPTPPPRHPGDPHPAPPDAPGRHRAPEDDPVTIPIPIQRSEETEEERRVREAREHRAAIARSIAARRAANVVTPVDQDDEETEYYRRTSWLI